MFLTEAITHIEDLPVNEFISTVRSLKGRIITEKVDGAALYVGVDADGMFTSREGKRARASRYHDADDYPKIVAFNGFRAAHKALEHYEPQISSILADGDLVELEVLFGSQPNTVAYKSDTNHIVFLRGLNGTDGKKVSRLASTLNGKTVRIESLVIGSKDGHTLDHFKNDQVWKFSSLKDIDVSQADFSKVDGILDQLEDLLAKKSGVSGYTNDEITRVSLTTVPKDERDDVRIEREKLLDRVRSDFMIPIKEILSKEILPKSSILGSADIEGVVIRDPVSGAQTKIVNRDGFTQENKFNNEVLNSIYGSVRSLNPQLPLASRGGIFGEAKIKIAEIIGLPNLALTSQAAKILAKHKGATIEETADSFADSLGLHATSSIKRQIINVLRDTLTKLDKELAEFKSTKRHTTLLSGKKLELSNGAISKALAAFAETKQQIKEMEDKIAKASTGGDLIMAIYELPLTSLFTGENAMSDKINETADGAVTAASGVAPFQKRLFNSKLLHRKVPKLAGTYKFPKDKKKPFEILTQPQQSEGLISRLPLLSSVMENVADKIQAKKDPTFAAFRDQLAAGNNISPNVVSNYLKAADNLDDAVDTVAFGLETDDGKVVKVYVDAMQSGEFEQALANLFGQEPDIEKAINQLATTFNVVDVEYPENFNDETAGGEGAEDSFEVDPNLPTEVEDFSADDLDLDTINHHEDDAGDINATGTVDATDATDEDEEDDGLTRDDFGQVIDGEEDTDSDEEDESTEDEESTDDESEESTDTDDESTDGEESTESDDESDEDSTEDESDDESTDGEDEDTDEDEEEDESDERDEFGQMGKKKKKKGAVKEDFSFLFESDAKIPHPGLHLIGKILTNLDIDIHTPWSYYYMARQISLNDPVARVLKNSDIITRLKYIDKEIAEEKKKVDAAIAAKAEKKKKKPKKDKDKK